MNAGDLEHLANVRIRYDHDQLTRLPVELPCCAEKDMERGGVDERRFGKVDDEARGALRERRGQRPLELGRRVEVKLAPGSNDECPVCEPPARDHELEAGRKRSDLARQRGPKPNRITATSHPPPPSKTDRSSYHRQTVLSMLTFQR